MTIQYAPDVILDEVVDLITTATSGLALPCEPGGSTTLNVIDGIIDPANLPTAPYCFIDVLDGYAGDYAKKGFDDLITVGIQTVIYCEVVSDVRWLSRLKYIINRALAESDYYSGQMMKLDQNQIKSHWIKVFDKEIKYPFQMGILEITFRLPNPGQMAIINTPAPTP